MGFRTGVEKELCGKSGIVDVLWRTKATHFLAGDDHPLVGSTRTRGERRAGAVRPIAPREDV